MNKTARINSVFVLFLSLCFLPAKSQLLWKATSPSGVNMYLLGTMHLPMGNYVMDHPGVKAAIDSCDCVYTEVSVDQDSISQIIFNYIFLPEAMLLSDSLDDMEWLMLDSLVHEIDPRMTAHALDRFKPMYVQMLVAFSRMTDTTSSDSQISVDASVRGYAISENKKIAYLESQDEQLGFVFNDISLASQFALMRKMLNRHTPENKMEKLVWQLPYYYQKQDLDTVEIIINAISAGGMEERQFFSSLLENRNRKWVSKMLLLAEESDQTFFFAVGAGHLPGRVGLLELLRNEGFTVVPIPYE